MSQFTLALGEIAFDAKDHGIPIWGYGVGMFILLMILLAITLSYSNVFNKHPDPVTGDSEPYDPIDALTKNDVEKK